MNQHRIHSTAQIQRKRKEREDPGPGFYNTNYFLSASINNKPTPLNTTSSLLSSSSSSKPLSPKPLGTAVQANRMLAGYMANEYLTRGTILGQKFDPARAEVSFSSSLVEQPKQWVKPRGESTEPGKVELRESTSYAEVAALLKTDGTHIPGVFNPTQLARWIQK